MRPLVVIVPPRLYTGKEIADFYDLPEPTPELVEWCATRGFVPELSATEHRKDGGIEEAVMNVPDESTLIAFMLETGGEQYRS